MELRIPKYLSPSAYFQWVSDRYTFFEQRLSPTRKPKPPQVNYMACGSAVDAFVKSDIHTKVHGENATKGSPFEFQTIFESQVEEHIRDDVLERSTDLWQQYQDSGAYDNLLKDILASPFAPEMEFTVTGEIHGVPIIGKPDLRYITKSGVHVVDDWKVNGSCSKTGASPVQGYKLCLDTYGSNTHNKPYKARRLKADPPNKVYKDFKPLQLKDVVVNEYFLEEFSPDWATQLAIYAWLLGEPIGSEDFVIRMEQMACRPVKTRTLPRAKFATHMARISQAFQTNILANLKMCWETIKSGHIFTDVSRERSDEICEQLVAKRKIPVGLHPALDSCRDTSLRYK